MDAVASEVAISRLIGRLQELISPEAILPRELQTRMSKALSILQNKVYVSSSPGVGLFRAYQPQICAREVENIMDMFLVKALMTPKSWRGRIAAHLNGKVQLVTAPLRIRVPTKRVKAARKLVQKVEELCREFHETCEGNDSNHENRTSHPNLSDELAIVGREDAVDRLIFQLTDSDWLRVFSVVGNEGIGKTALVRSVYNRLDTMHRFECRAWICNSNEPSLESVVVDILKQSAVKALKDLELKEIKDLGKLLHESLMELRYLIVLDDLKSPDLLNNLLYYLPDSRNGSRVILTYREVIPVPRPQEPWGFRLPLEQLDVKNSHKLLLKHSLIKNGELIDKILHKCDGSPSKILLFGGLTAASESSDLECPPTAWAGDLEDDHGQPDVRFLSFKSLPSWVKPCLLYLCLFPKESEISTRRIFQLWQAEGLVSWDQGYSTAEACFQKLVDRNLLQVVSRRDVDETAKTCRLSGHLHDYFTELATSSRSTSVLPWLTRYSSHKTSPPLQDAETASRISSYISLDTQKLGIRSREVELLLKPLAGNRDSMLLRVLDLEGVYKPKLPKQFGTMLPNLRYLGLRWTILDSLPESVSKLSRLETLDLKHTNVTKLPSSILHLKYIRHLYLNEVSFDNCKPTESCLSNIQTLWGLSIGANSSFLCVLGRLNGLRKLGLTCDATVIPEVTESISTMTVLESLRLRSRDLFGQPSDLKISEDMEERSLLKRSSFLNMFLQKSFNQESSRCLTSEDMKERSLLKVTSFFNIILQKSFNQKSSRCPTSEDMKEQGSLSKLRSVSKLYLLGGLSQESLKCFPKNLRVLTLSMSEMNFDPMKILGQLQHLNTLRLFANSFNGEGMVCQRGSFPSLQVLRLWKLEKLKKLTINPGAIQSLEELDMRDCKQMRKMVGLKHASKLKQIKLTQVSKDFAEDVKSIRPNPTTMVTIRALNVSAPEDKEEAGELEQEEEEEEEEDEEF